MPSPTPPHASIPRCTKCKRAFAPHFGGEKNSADLTFAEVVIEKGLAKAKIERLLQHVDSLANMTAAFYPTGAVCNVCGHGWREFENHTKDLRQLDINEARVALTAARTLLASVIAQENKHLEAMKADASEAGNRANKTA